MTFSFILLTHCVTRKKDFFETSNVKLLPTEIFLQDSGLPVDLAVRYQINMALGSIKTIANAERFNEMVLPLLWTEIVSPHISTAHAQIPPL